MTARVGGGCDSAVELHSTFLPPATLARWRVGRVLRSMPRSRSYPLVGALLALAAPVGLAIVHALSAGQPPTLAFARQDIAALPGAYAYVVLWSLLLASVPGYLLGRAFDRSRLLAITDPLTGVFNRRYFSERLATEMSRSRRTGRVMSVLCLDIDRLKTINDELGHDAGDRALVSVARAISDSVRAVDVVARFGGDEFTVLLPDTDVSEASGVSQRILARLAHDDDGSRFALTVSIGMAVLAATASSADALRAADNALYGAKAAGRGRRALRDEDRNASGELTQRDATRATAAQPARIGVRP